MKPIRGLVMSADRTVRRLRVLNSILNPSQQYLYGVRYVSASGENQYISLGDVSLKIKDPEHPELVPIKYKVDDASQTILKHLRWIMQKDSLGQDVFLIGPPGPLRRTVAMMYLELTQKEAEYLSLSRDTTETDLKQRREITSGSAIHIDQACIQLKWRGTIVIAKFLMPVGGKNLTMKYMCAVRAATKGRVLVLEGIEKAERNVLPVLNNLLENREMQLDDGRFLMSATRYDKLMQEHSKEELDAWNLVRVHEDFRVIALGLPVPRYQGNPLDPPLRSRFQARDVNPIPFKDRLNLLSACGERISQDNLLKILSFATTLISDETHSLGLPDFPIDNLQAIVKILSAAPSSSIQHLMERLYPYKCMFGNEGQTAVKNALKQFELLESLDSNNRSLVAQIRYSKPGSKADVTLQSGHNIHAFQVMSGTLDMATSGTSAFVSTPFHDELLAEMIQSHYVKDFCIIGSRGCGKSVLVRRFAELLNYHVEPIMLYQDMTARDLLQQRTTSPSGDTAWRFSPLITAALEGSLAVLDGVHRVNAGTFSVLHRLVHDREITLFDGTRLLRHDRFQEIKEKLSLNDEEMKSRGLLSIHPSFRIIALAEPPVIGSSSQQWLNAEQLTMFLYHHMRIMSVAEELHILKLLVPQMPDMQKVIDWTHKLRESADTNLKSVATSLSTRQLLRISRRLAAYSDENVYDVLNKACLTQFLPRLARTAFEEELSNLGITPSPMPNTVDGVERSITCEIKDGTLRIGNTRVPVHSPDSKMKVPDVLFYENAQHLAVMEDMLKDYLLGEHLLLIGNQGVGKNKIVDRFLHLLNRPREYLQLHRDTTVQTLTLQPTVVDGIIVYEDSPLVRAIKLGHILIVDEADKAPTSVTCILKTLVESGEMHLADGRRIVSGSSGRKGSSSVIVTHPDFRMFVLANRPGFPFLGNDFFGAMGDIFSCHAVDNPDMQSEMSMLQQYGPNVPEETLRRLVVAFGELRTMADQGLISYPYSTREVVNVVKHLEKYPNEGLVNVVRNVFDFDLYNKELKETLLEILHKHGIPIGADPRNVQLAKEYALPSLQRGGEWTVRKVGDRQRTKPFSCPVEEKPFRVKGQVELNMQSFPLDLTEARSVMFTEQEAFWTIPLHESSAVVDVAVSKGLHRRPGRNLSDVIHIATTSPVCLYSMDTRKQRATCIDMYDIFPSASSRYQSSRPRLRLAPLGSALDENIVIHEELLNTVLNVNYETGRMVRIELGSFVEEAAGKISRNFRAQQGAFKMVKDFAHESSGRLLFYKEEGDYIDVVDMLEGRCHSISLPLKLSSISMVSQFDWVLVESQTNRKFLLSHTNEDPWVFVLQSIDENTTDDVRCELFATRSLGDLQLSAAIGQQIKSPNRVIASPDHYATVAVGFPDCTSADLYISPRQSLEALSSGKGAPNHSVSVDKLKVGKTPVAYLPESGQIVRLLSTTQVPKGVVPEGVKPSGLSAYLEISDIVNRKLRYIPIPGVSGSSVYNHWYYTGLGSPSIDVLLSNTSNDGLVTVDRGGCVRLWETALYSLTKSLNQWRSMIGDGSQKNLEVSYEKDLEQTSPWMPKHGQMDPTGAPHVGGSNFAGGSGGMNTAGLGGVGGPYRLDSGNAVFQVSDFDKDLVPEEVRRAARDLAERAWKERLKQIKMSEYDGEMYDRFSSSVRHQVKLLRVMLDTLQAKGKERQWLKHQTHGDLDEAKLIEGLTGERGIYKRRGEKEPEMGSPQEKPKLLKLLCDVSGSMYRFNGQDGRLDRELEAILMVMEAFDGYETKIKFEVFGHSGEGFSFPFLKADSPPKNNKERLDTLMALHAHSQFCISGDNTLEAAKHAIEQIAEEDVDERFVIVLSDANLERYGIRPKRLSEILTMNDEINAYVIFIGSLGDQAQRIMKQMPSGRAFVCLDTKNLPSILQQIFTSTMLSTR